MYYNKDDLYETNLHSLRIIGREVGVYAPTHLKKQELINEIMSIVNGEKLPCKPSRKGRPVKQNIEYVSDKLPTLKAKLEEEKQAVLDEKEKAQLLREQVKQEMIIAILQEIEKKLNKLL